MKVSMKVLKMLYKDAEKAYKKKEIPVSAVIVDEMGNIVSHACNNRQKEFNVLGHAEVVAIIKAEKKIKDWRLSNCCMYVTLEPCSMCSMIIKESRIKKVYYFLSSNDQNFESFGINKKEIVGYKEEKDKFKELLTSFFDNRR